MSKKKRATIEQLLKFINKSSIEPMLTWVVPNLYDKNIEYELQWTYDRLSEDNFYIRKKGEDVWKQMDADNLVQFMSQERLDMAAFEFQIQRVIYVQAVCSHYFIERAGDLVGKDKIQEAIKLITNFAEEREETPSNKVPRLKLVKRKKKKNDPKKT